MTADRPRLAAAAEAVLRAAFGAGSVTSDELADDARPAVLAALAPHVPERDELVAGLRLALGRVCIDRDRVTRDWPDGAVDDAMVGYLSAIAGLRKDEIRACIDVALIDRHAPEQPDV